MPESIEEIANRLSRAGDRYRNAGDMANAARCDEAAQQAASAPDIDAAMAIESSFMASSGERPSWFSRFRHALGIDAPRDNS
jgi:hypothetical protein